MAKVSKRMKEISAKINAEKTYPVSEAFDLLR
ncbi:50S ribosomal protein L1, partial [Francisella tularensis subsp. holarctica]|nr:50S ribosomal protein L1 [Francisella tularensis subsp. holarctica]